MMTKKIQSESENRYPAPALEKGLDILELLAENGSGLSQGEIAQSLGKTPNEIYRMLSTLVRRDYVLRSVADDRYKLSLKMFWLSQRHPPVSRLIEIATPLMRKTAKIAWQSCHLGMENDGNIVVVTSAESPGQWSLALRPGSVIGLANTGTGRVMAAFRSQKDIDHMLEKHKPVLGEPEIDHDVFLQRLADIKEKGFEVSASETAIGVTNIAFPIFDPFGKALAVLCCPYLKRIDEFEVPSVEEATHIFGQLSYELTALYGGKIKKEHQQNE